MKLPPKLTRFTRLINSAKRSYLYTIPSPSFFHNCLLISFVKINFLHYFSIQLAWVGVNCNAIVLIRLITVLILILTDLLINN